MTDAPLMLSVSGLRGLVGKSLTPEVAARYGEAIGEFFKSRRGRSPHVMLGRDSRPSGRDLESAVAVGLVGAGCRVTLLGVASTPGVAVMVTHAQADGGVVITASHNPIEWNGIKTLTHLGAAPAAEDAQKIIDRFRHELPELTKPDERQPASRDDTAADVHVRRVLEQVDVRAIRSAKLKVLLDSVHGAGGPEGAMLLGELGVTLVHLYAQPTGQFPHTPEPTKENLTGLCDAVRRHGADLGFAQDPDADRLAIVDETGGYIGEEYTLALAAMHVLDKLGDKARGKRLAANLSTSRMIDDVAARAGASVVRTPVGEANVVAAMLAPAPGSTDCILGGEGNGGVILPQVCLVRDSLVGIALTLEMLARRGGALSRVVASIPAYAIVKEKIPAQPALMASLHDRLRKRFPGQKIDTQDGVRIDWPDRWVHVRASNTEPILRLIAEARNEAEARKVLAQARAALGL